MVQYEDINVGKPWIYRDHDHIGGNIIQYGKMLLNELASYFHTSTPYMKPLLVTNKEDMIEKKYVYGYVGQGSGYIYISNLWTHVLNWLIKNEPWNSYSTTVVFPWNDKEVVRKLSVWIQWYYHIVAHEFHHSIHVSNLKPGATKTLYNNYEKILEDAADKFARMVVTYTLDYPKWNSIFLGYHGRESDVLDSIRYQMRELWAIWETIREYDEPLHGLISRYFLPKYDSDNIYDYYGAYISWSDLKEEYNLSAF